MPKIHGQMVPLRGCLVYIFTTRIKTTPYGKIFKLFRNFSSRYRSSLLCSNFVKFGRREIGKIVRILLDKKHKISPASQSVATAQIAPKISQDQPPTMYLYSGQARFHPNRVTLGRVIANRANTAKSPRIK